MIWNKRLKQLRENSRLTLLEVSKKLGVSEATAQRYENDNGIKNIPYEQIIKYAQLFNVSPQYIMGWDDNVSPIKLEKGNTRVISVLGRVAAGVPIEMIEDIIGQEEIPTTWQGDFFALQIHGDSMEPRFSEGDVVIVRKQEDVESGQIAIVIVNGDDATCKKIKKLPDGIMLVPFNPKYDEQIYDRAQIASLPVKIIGRVVELRAKF